MICNSTFRCLAFLVLGVFQLGCRVGSGGSPPQTSFPAPGSVNAIVIDWLTCEECNNGEAEKVVQLGSKALRSLIEALREGPPPAALEREKRALEKRYMQLETYSRVRPDLKPGMSKDELVGLYLRGYVDRFKVRGARALGRIGGDEAKAALEQALADPNNSESVKRVIREALIDIKAPTADQFFGRWANEDPKTGGWTRIEIRADDADLYVQLWGSCQPTDCNAGEWPVPICDSDDRALRLQIDHGHAIRKMDLTLLSDHRMSVRTQTRFVDNSGRPDQDTTDTFVKR